MSAGDVQGAFLNGHEARRNLFFSQPPRGLPSGTCVFGLTTSPRLWWEKLAADLRNLTFALMEDTLIWFRVGLMPATFCCVINKVLFMELS